MKRLIAILLFQFFALSNVFAENFHINGVVLGKETFNYAYIFDIKSNLIGQAKISDHHFFFTGPIEYKQKFGQLPNATILLSQTVLTVDEINAQRLLSNRKHNNCTIILEESIDLSYDTDRKLFSVKGGKQNEIQNLFINGYSIFRNSRDSIYLSIDKSDLSEREKEAVKVTEAKKLFTKTMFGFINIIKLHRDSEVTLFNFSPIIYDQGINGQQVLEAFNLFTQRLRESEYGIHVYPEVTKKIKAEEIMAAPAYTVGMKIPAFSLSNENNEVVKSESQFSKYTLIDFWATWCIPCRNETPNIIHALTGYKKKGFNVITVSIDDTKDKRKWIEAIKNDKMSGFTNLFNGNDNSGIAKELKIVSIPANYLVDNSGKIIATNLRGEQLIKKLQDLFAE